MPQNHLRTLIRQKRQALSIEQREINSHLLADNISKSRIFLNSRRIACYLAVDGEIDLTPIMQIAWSMGKQVCLPVLGLPYENRLWFAKFYEHDPLVPNKFGIYEPVITKKKRVSTRSIDLVLAPLVAFDDKGNRMGMGGGYYDRSFAFLRHRNHWQKPILMGVAFELQRAEKLYPQDWDIPLQAIVTEKSILKINRTR